MEIYIKIKLSFSDKIKLLIFNLLPENLMNKEMVENTATFNDSKVKILKKKEVIKDINIDETIPFFDCINESKANF